jgi:alpha-glucosidase (family GH31 glycosyl hydrolase)
MILGPSRSACWPRRLPSPSTWSLAGIPARPGWMTPTPQRQVVITPPASFPIPWVLSSRGYGLLLDQDDVSYERFRTEAADQWSVEVESASLRYRLFAGPAPLDALRRFTAATGRQPEPARWFFGPWYQSGHANHVPLEEEERQVEVLRGSPASVVETHCRYLPLGEDRGHADEERARTGFFHSQGLAALSYINPLVGRDYPDAFDAAASAGALQKDGYGKPCRVARPAGSCSPRETNRSVQPAAVVQRAGRRCSRGRSRRHPGIRPSRRGAEPAARRRRQLEPLRP